MRGTSNGNVSGSSADRRARRAYLVDTFGWRLADGSGLVCCYRCEVVLLEHDDPGAPGQGVTVDRIVPGCEGGRYVRGNIRPACGPCNQETGGRLGGQRRGRPRPATRGDLEPSTGPGRHPVESARTGAVTQSRTHSRTPSATGHSRTHASVTVDDERAGESSHGSSHGTHEAGHSRFPPTLYGGGTGAGVVR